MSLEMRFVEKRPCSYKSIQSSPQKKWQILHPCRTVLIGTGDQGWKEYLELGQTQMRHWWS